MGLTRGEAQRKLLHIAVGGFGLLLRWLTWPQAAALALTALAFNWQVLPRIGGRRLWRAHEQARGYTRGMLLYPLAVLALVLVFRHELWKAAAVWALLALGDGLAGLVGQAWGGPRLPWNRDKGWAGFLACWVGGALGAAAWATWTWLGPAGDGATRPVGCGSWPCVGLWWLFPVVALAGALAESARSTLDDNLLVPLCGALTLAYAVGLSPAELLHDAAAPQRAAAGVAVNTLVALLAYKARSIDGPGALSAVLIGTLVTLGTGLRGFAVMAAFFVVGSVVTRLGYRIKAARGIAQERGGARGWRNAWANGGVPAVLALGAGMTVGDGTPGAGWPAAWLVLAYAASVATAAADTCSSEVGKAYGRRTFLITSLRPVPPGTEGAVSLEGTLGGLAGGLLVAAVGAAVGLYGWLLVPLVGLVGLLGSLAESVVGTLAERRGWLDNDQLNALNTAIGGALMLGLLHGGRAFGGWNMP